MPRLDWFHSLSFDIARALLTAQSSLLAAGTHSVASILPFIRPGADFDDEATRIMGEAFDAACKEIHDAAPLDIVHEAMAKRIIEAARKGERPAYWTEAKDYRPTPLYSYELLRPGNTLEGPAILEGEYTTVVVPPSMKFSIDERGLGILES